MKCLSLIPISLIALLALTPLPAVADGAGPRASSVPQPGDPARKGFVTAQAFFGIFLQSGGSFITPVIYFHDNFMLGGAPETEAERAQRRYVEWVVKERKRKEAERRAREAEKERKAAENRSEDDLPGLDY